MRQLIAGNWKMNGTLDLVGAIAGPLRGLDPIQRCDLVVCPPATLLHVAAHALLGTPAEVGGQDCHADESGPYTGDLSASMLREAGAKWVIIGHSERRAAHGETDQQVRGKVLATRAAGLTPIVCVGETQEQRLAGSETDVVGWQLEGSLPKDFAGVVAYEPVWAIGSGRVPRPEEIAAMHAFIRGELQRQLGSAAAGTIRILYGGSVNADNAAALLAIPEVGGALVGGASLDPAAFLAITQAMPLAPAIAVGTPPR